MKLVIGLGNPGEKFANSRHNVGHMFVDWALSFKFRIQNAKFRMKLVKTNTFMNESGEFVKKIAASYGLLTTDLCIVHDDLDIHLGEFKIQFGKGPKVHNGLASIEEVLGTKDFWRVRIGTDSRGTVPGQKLGDSGKEFVLKGFVPRESQILLDLFPEVWESLRISWFEEPR